MRYPDPMLTGGAVGLRLLEAADRDLYRALWTSPEAMQAVGAVLTLPEADAQFDRTVRHNGSLRPGHRTWVIHAPDGGRPVGIIALSRLEAKAEAELGVMILPSAWRQKVATNAIALLLPHALGQMGLVQVLASRCDDAYAPIVAQLLAPFGFEQTAGRRPGEAGWRVST